MNLLALLLGLGIERALTRLLHLREFHRLDPLFSRVFHALANAGPILAFLALLGLALLLTLPVLALGLWLAAEAHWGYFAFAIVVLLFSLGPRDLEREVSEYVAAVEGNDAAAADSIGREIAEHGPAEGPVFPQDVERSIYLQANNRVFGVIFWFLVLGAAAPAGAWLFRVTDLVRRHAVSNAMAGEVAVASRRLHGLLAWLPARMTAVAFALGGSFVATVNAWRSRTEPAARYFYERSDLLLERTGRAARDAPDAGLESGQRIGEAAPVRSAMALVRRSLWVVWYPAIALLTLGNWLP